MARGRAYAFSERGGGGLRFGGCDSSGQWLYIPKTRVYIYFFAFRFFRLPSLRQVHLPLKTGHDGLYLHFALTP